MVIFRGFFFFFAFKRIYVAIISAYSSPFSKKTSFKMSYKQHNGSGISLKSNKKYSRKICFEDYKIFSFSHSLLNNNLFSGAGLQK